MLSHSTILSENPHILPPVSAVPTITLRVAVHQPAGRADSTPQHVPPKRLSCKTCQGKCCIGRCRFWNPASPCGCQTQPAPGRPSRSQEGARHGTHACACGKRPPQAEACATMCL